MRRVIGTSRSVLTDDETATSQIGPASYTVKNRHNRTPRSFPRKRGRIRSAENDVARGTGTRSLRTDLVTRRRVSILGLCVNSRFWSTIGMLRAPPGSVTDRSPVKDEKGDEVMRAGTRNKGKTREGKNKEQKEKKRERWVGWASPRYIELPAPRADIVFRYLDLCIGIRLKPSYTQEDSRVTAPAGP